ncbi:hypothetical protein H6P81_007839 [Aristolochia fimbriata]|uniref:C2H2-type domain-containing protein n=1 Tax=Aristolochia fimbriata TaxID=158543 RepID=A0AAV7F1C8_ARIFI|nr:hypothetical protein H6P81_007839 [Aristolochia fimbriata]
MFGTHGCRILLRLPSPTPAVSARHLGPLSLSRLLHAESSIPSSPSSPSDEQSVGIFWDLDNKPPKNFPPYDAAVRLKLAAAAFGRVRYTYAYANHHAFAYVPPVIRQQRQERKEQDLLESRGLAKPSVPYICRVCGRNFYTHPKLVTHFKQIHEREQMKRLNRLESARGRKRVDLAAKLSMKMHKYKAAARDLLTPRVGYGLGDELKRAGFLVRVAPDKPQSADAALRNHVLEMMDRRLVGCVVIVSDDADFAGVLGEARQRSVKTVVVGDNERGSLRRMADGGFSWKEIVLGKAKKEAESVVGRWKDREILKQLEWTYKTVKSVDADSSGSELEDYFEEEDDQEKQNIDGDGWQRWWELESGEVRSTK